MRTAKILDIYLQQTGHPQQQQQQWMGYRSDGQMEGLDADEEEEEEAFPNTENGRACLFRTTTVAL